MKERQMLSLNAFKGVDLSSAPTMVSQSRASYSVNMINDNGINHKRPGWDEQYEFDGRINGMYHYANGGKKVIIVYAGSKFYEYSDGNHTDITPANLNLVDSRVQFFPHKERLYIVGCGEYLVYGTWDNGKTYKIQLVSEAEDTYVPTTILGSTPSVVYVNEVDGPDKGKETIKSQGTTGDHYEKLNVLVRDGRRKESFVLDRLIVADEYIFCILSQVFSSSGIKAIHFADKTYRVTATTGDYPKEIIIDNGEKLQLIGESDKDECTGVNIKWGAVRDSLISNNMEFSIEYIPLNTKDKSSLVTECSFGTIFGAFGNADRLFLSGNASLPNCDFYSEYDDFTYFTEGSKTAMGSDEVPITGYLRLSDDVLATLKADNPTEPTIYYRSATEVENSEGYTDIAFTRWAGGINEGCVNPHTVVNLAGDDIFVSPNGVYGVVQVQNTSKNDRYIRQRDIYINAELRNRDLSDAVSFVYRNRYYLSLGNGECYVADPRYKNYLSEDIDGSFNYEWWKWLNVPARVFANVDGELWFGDNAGRICRFDDKFCDRTHTETASGDVMHDSDTISFNKALDVRDGDIVKLCKPHYFFRSFLSNVDVQDDWIQCSPEMIVRVYEGQALTSDNFGEVTAQVDFYVTVVDRGNCAFKIGYTVTESIDIKQGGFNLYIPIRKGECFKVIDVNKNDSTFRLRDEYGVVDIANFLGVTPTIHQLEFEHRRNVRSEWYTPVFDLGAPYLHKTLHRLNVTIDPNVRGSLQVGYETNDKLAYIGASAGKVFSFDDFSFNDFSFTTGFTATQSQKVKARNFNYIMFRFVSDNDADCAIDNFSAEYTYNGGRFAGTR